MKKISVIIISTFLLFLFASCASTSKSQKNVTEPEQLYAVVELGEYKVSDVKQFTEDQLVIQYMYEETSGLRIDNKDGADYYNGTPLKGLPMTEIKDLMGSEKFSVYWAICYELTQLGKKEDTRVIRYIFPNKDYFMIDMKGNIFEDMVMTSMHDNPDERVDLQILMPISLVNSN